jgi:hypothetical protein
MGMVPKIRTAATFEAVDREAVVHLEEDNQGAVDILLEDHPNLLAKETINNTTRVSQPAGSATFPGIAKKIAARESGRINPVLDSMGHSTGPNQNNLRLMKTKKKRERKKLKEQLGKCILATWPMFFRVFNEGRS